MITTIECACGRMIVYDVRCVMFRCPNCRRNWYQAPPLFSDDGMEAERFPYLFYRAQIGDDVYSGSQPESLDDPNEVASHIRKAIQTANDFRSMFTIEPIKQPETIVVVDKNGNSIEVAVPKDEVPKD